LFSIRREKFREARGFFMNDSNLELSKKDTIDLSKELTDAELQMLRGLNARGFAVVVFSADELGGAYYLDVEDAMVEAGWNFILNFDINSQS
jgi:hypothetical protein